MATTLHLTDQQAAGLQELIALAVRSREDFQKQASFGEHSPEAVAAAQQRWNAAQATIRSIEIQQGQRGPAALDALDQWAEVIWHLDDCDTWSRFRCEELEVTAELARVIGRDELADRLLFMHSFGDVEEEDQHHALYLKNTAEQANLKQ